ncbi:MAG: hypothetical protein ACD_19C00187G0018 [uncultured bacterium]|nr:MAG: hypothetical protein ACD_19C00187G0018 [uncultured bacterium]
MTSLNKQIMFELIQKLDVLISELEEITIKINFKPRKHKRNV